MVERDEENEWKPSSVNEVSVMVVDDDNLITRLVAGALKAIGIRKIYTMNDPHQAMDFVAEGLGGIDLILCDLMMPEVDGLTILKQVRETRKKLPFLMLTADGTSDSVKQAASLGVTGYMIKPFSIDDLQAKVRQTLSRAYGAKAADPVQPGAEHQTRWS